MPVDTTQSNRLVRLPSDETQRGTFYRASAPAENRRQYVVALLLTMVLVVLCVLAAVLGYAILSDSGLENASGFITDMPGENPLSPVFQPTRPGSGPNQAQISIEPAQGQIGTLITVTGQNWWPGEPVFVFLRSSAEADSAGYAYAAAVADEQGQFRTGLTFPNEVRWIGTEWADVTAQGSRSGLRASARFTLVLPTPTATLPAPTPPPTAPARPPTATPPPTPSPLPQATATPVVITDWRGEYYDNTTLAGEPVVIRNDTTVDFAWGTSAPAPDLPADGFSARWSRQQPFSDGTYRFALDVDDGARFWIDGRLVIDDWQDGPLRPHTFDLYLPAGDHTLSLEYYEDLGEAAIQLSWARVESPTTTPTSSPTPSPTTTPTVTSPPPASEPWQGSYHDNPDLAGEPVLVREDAELNFAWGAGSPGEAVPADSFSARWTRDLWVPAGTHRFFLEVDDGARVWVDGVLLIDAWHIATGESFSAERGLSEGVHRIVVEYFEAFLDARIHLWIEGP